MHVGIRKRIAFPRHRLIVLVIPIWMASYVGANAGVTFAGRTISVIVGFSPGGAYDLYARVLSRHIGRHLPGNPTVIVQNMPGAGGLRAANYLYQAAPKNGTVFGTFARGVVIGPLFGEGAFDSTQFTWLGSISDDVNVCVSWYTSDVKMWNDLLTHHFTVAGQGPHADTDVYANLVKNLFGAPIRLVSGYPGSNDIALAMERGEVDGVCALSYSTVKSTFRDRLENNQINIVFQAGLKKAPDLPNVPLLLDFARDDRQRAVLKLVMGVQGMARPFVAPPGLAPEIRDDLRRAFDDTMHDPAFLDEAKTMNLEVNPASGPDVDTLVGELYRTPKGIIEEVRQAIAGH
jgi:tripartite-type tricarboxylate transporter receptor subunit TctC